MAGVSHGFLVGVALVTYGVYFRWRDYGPASLWAWGFYVLLPAGVLWAQLGMRAVGGPLPMGHYWWAGFLAGAVGSAIYVVYVYVQNRFVNDSFLRALVEHQSKRLEGRGLDPERAARLMRRTEALAQPGPFAGVVFVQLSVVSALVAGAGGWWLGL